MGLEARHLSLESRGYSPGIDMEATRLYQGTGHRTVRGIQAATLSTARLLWGTCTGDLCGGAEVKDCSRLGSGYTKVLRQERAWVGIKNNMRATVNGGSRRKARH